ncbi:MAG: hypothetical protein IJB26_05650, partial [Clostridia bacterium]|nr:hypothetical protein [Clostridia bacterium]
GRFAFSKTNIDGKQKAVVCAGAALAADGGSESGRGHQKTLVLLNECFFIQAAGLVYHHALACISSP